MIEQSSGKAVKFWAITVAMIVVSAGVLYSPLVVGDVCAVSPDGKSRVHSTGAKYTIHNLVTGRQGVLATHGTRFCSTKFSNDSQWTACFEVGGRGPYQVFLNNAFAPADDFTILDHDGPVIACEFAPTSDSIYVLSKHELDMCETSRTRLFQWSLSGQLLAKYELPLWGWEFDISPDGNRMVFGDRRRISLLEMNDGKPGGHRRIPLPDAASAVAFSATGDLVAAAGSFGVRGFDWETADERFRHSVEFGGRVEAVSFVSQEPLEVVVQTTSKIYLCEVSKEKTTVLATEEYIRWSDMTTDGREVRWISNGNLNHMAIHADGHNL